MQTLRVERAALTLAAFFSLGLLTARAATIGSAFALVDRVAGRPSTQEIFIPLSATEFQTPAANLEAVLETDRVLFRSKARAVAGIDVPDGALFGSIATYERKEVPGPQGRAFARVRVYFEDTFEVRSDTLPVGTLADIRVSLTVAHVGSLSATGLGNCCAVNSIYRARVEGGSATSSDYPRLPTLTHTGVLAGHGLGMENEPFLVHLGPFTAQAPVGDEFDFEVYFEIESNAYANGEVDVDRRPHAGQAEATASAMLLFATEVVPAAASPAAADSFAKGGSADGGSSDNGAGGYLYNPTTGLRLPGLEALDPVNVAAHLLPFQPVPEPSSWWLAVFAMASGVCARTQSPTRPVNRLRRGIDMMANP